jgi:hypothetical protein
VNVPLSTVTVPLEGEPQTFWSAAIVKTPALTVPPFVTVRLPLP